MQAVAPPPPVVIHTEEDDDDDMADLFSFGSGEATDTTTTSPSMAAVTTPTFAVERPDSPDSFLEMLSAETSSILPGDGKGAADDKEAMEILNWLDANDDEDDGTEQIVFQSSLQPPENVTSTAEPTLVPLPPSFDSFQEAMESSEQATKEQIRALYVKDQAKSDTSILVSPAQRVELYCRMICGRTLEQTETSSLADSFTEWRKERENNTTTPLPHANLGSRIAALTGNDSCLQDLNDLIGYYEQQSSTKETTDDLLPPIAAAILSTGVPVAAGAVLLSQLIPSFMPLLALPAETERWEAALSLHSEFYLLASYHIPLLVVHLDRHLSGWYWPKLHNTASDNDDTAVLVSRNLTRHGQIPPSWLLTHLAGDGTTLLPTAATVLHVWDGVLTSQNKARRFFLTLAVLERWSPRLLLLTGPELVSTLETVWTLQDIDVEKEPSEKEWIVEWGSHATILEQATPGSALERLENTEDTAVQNALVMRQKRSEEALQARLEAEAAAHRDAQERKAEEARQRLSRARLIAFYRKHAPSKESNIEKIMETYTGRLDVLDAKLRGKYGEGFNPALKPKPIMPQLPNKNMLANINKNFIRKKSESESSEAEELKRNVVSLSVTPAEVLPVICWSKEEARADRRKNQSERRPLKYYLVDGRSEEAVAEQGRFPTAVSLSPEALMDPERMQQVENMFESLRGACHIAIMGEGFSALPRLYNQKMSPKLTELMEQDESRTNSCALFFQKRGFCFVSVLDGGFCAAHSWLSREGASKHLTPSGVLVDYNPEASLFSQLETLHTASATEKAQRKMANLLESSLVTMTRKASQIERLALGLEESRRGLRGINHLFGRSESGVETTGADLKLQTTEETTKNQPFTNPFKREEQSEAAPSINNGVEPAKSPSEVGIALGKWGGGIGAAAKAKWGMFRRKGGEGGGRPDGKVEGTARLEKV